MDIRKITGSEMTDAVELIWTTFLQFEAPDYCEEGVQSFRNFIENKEIMETLELWGAYENEELKGVLAANENRKHIFWKNQRKRRPRRRMRIWKLQGRTQSRRRMQRRKQGSL